MEQLAETLLGIEVELDWAATGATDERARRRVAAVVRMKDFIVLSKVGGWAVSW